MKFSIIKVHMKVSILYSFYLKGIMLFLIISLFFSCITPVHLKTIQDISSSVQKNHFSGVILLTAGGRTLFYDAYGWADKKTRVPNTIITRFSIASISKQFTAACLLSLQSRGLLNMNDPISKYFPDFPNGSKISLRDLASHRSGLPRYLYGIPLEEGPLSSLLWAEKMIDQKLITFKCKPGHKFIYSNAGYDFLSAVIEKVSGTSFQEALRNMI
ncbi:MAG: beta-lactamase family protein, partial [Spirochaetales bacterium]|nr:beta-lactamase family protein [Spirochaetales bacterium]